VAAMLPCVTMSLPRVPPAATSLARHSAPRPPPLPLPLPPALVPQVSRSACAARGRWRGPTRCWLCPTTPASSPRCRLRMRGFSPCTASAPTCTTTPSSMAWVLTRSPPLSPASWTSSALTTRVSCRHRDAKHRLCDFPHHPTPLSPPLPLPVRRCAVEAAEDGS